MGCQWPGATVLTPGLPWVARSLILILAGVLPLQVDSSNLMFFCTYFNFVRLPQREAHFRFTDLLGSPKPNMRVSRFIFIYPEHKIILIFL